MKTGVGVGIFTPEYRQIQEPRENLVGLLWHDNSDLLAMFDAD